MRKWLDADRGRAAAQHKTVVTATRTIDTNAGGKGGLRMRLKSGSGHHCHEVCPPMAISSNEARAARTSSPSYIGSLNDFSLNAIS